VPARRRWLKPAPGRITLPYAAGTTQKCKTANNTTVMANSEANDIAPSQVAPARNADTAHHFSVIAIKHRLNPRVCDVDHSVMGL
jgi:hypothetical protein